MRKAFFAALHDLMKRDPRVWFLTGDLGRGLVEPLFADFPERALNCGVIEPTMIGIAAGLARAGKIPFVYSIAPFIATRCAEQWKLDVAQPRLHVVGVGVGLDRSYRTAGASHWDDEVLALMQALHVPTLTAAPPSNDEGLSRFFAEDLCTRAFHAFDGPVFVRLP